MTTSEFDEPLGKGAQGEEEQFCKSCNSVINPHAVYCEFCGHRVSPIESPSKEAAALPDPQYRDTSSEHRSDFDSKKNQQSAKRLYQRHTDLIREFKHQTRALLNEVEKSGLKLEEISRLSMNEERRKETQQVLEKLEVIGDDWEGLQVDYNRQSEKLDEEFADECAEMDVDVELPPKLQSALREESTELVGLLQQVGETVGKHGQFGGKLIDRAGGRWAAAARDSGINSIVWIVFIIGMVGSLAVLKFHFGVENRVALIALAPCAIALLLGFLLTKRSA